MLKEYKKLWWQPGNPTGWRRNTSIDKAAETVCKDLDSWQKFRQDLADRIQTAGKLPEGVIAGPSKYPALLCDNCGRTTTNYPENVQRFLRRGVEVVDHCFDCKGGHDG